MKYKFVGEKMYIFSLSYNKTLRLKRNPVFNNGTHELPVGRQTVTKQDWEVEEK